MKKIFTIVAFTLLLSACGGLKDQGSQGTVDISKLVAQAADLCQQYRPVIDMASSLGLPSEIKIVGNFVDAFCTPLENGNVPATFDTNSLTWLTGNITALVNLLGIKSQPAT